MGTDVMVAITRKIIDSYDLHERTGFPRSISVPNRDAATQIVSDVVKSDLFLDFVLLLVDAKENGHMGRRYSIPYLREIINGVRSMGAIYDSENKIFLEDPSVSQTRNWGALKIGTTYTLAFLRVDIAGNSKIVRDNPGDKVTKMYDAFRYITEGIVSSRNGRIWAWDGDGGLGVFFVGNRNQSATLAGIELLHELFLYNRINPAIESGITVRVSAHSGDFSYSTDLEDLKASNTVQRTVAIEHKHTKPGTMTISPVVKLMLSHMIADEFVPFTASDRQTYYNYSLEMGES